MDSPQLGLAPPDEDSGEAGDDGEDILGPVGGVVLESGGPHRGEAGPGLLEHQAQVESSTRQEGGRDVGQGVLGQRHLHQVLGQGVLQNINVSCRIFISNVTEAKITLKRTCRERGR